MSDTQQILGEVYGCLSTLWLGPRDIDQNQVREDGRGVMKKLGSVDQRGAESLGRFLEENSVSEEEYIDLFELEPQCSLYLGSHKYEEPKTCAQAGVSDRNDYMIDLIGIYRHFGWAPDGKELPDYLPSLVEFLALTAASRGDPVRKKLINEYILPFLPPMRSRLEELKSPYRHLLDACERVLRIEGGGTSHVG